MGWPGRSASTARPTLLPRLRKLWHLVGNGAGFGQETIVLAVLALDHGTLEGAARELGKDAGSAHRMLRRLVARLEQLARRRRGAAALPTPLKIP